MFDGGIATAGDGNGGRGETGAKSGARGATGEPNEKGASSSSPRETADSAPGDLDRAGMTMLGTVARGVTGRPLGAERNSMVDVEAGTESLVAGAGSLSGEEEDSPVVGAGVAADGAETVFTCSSISIFSTVGVKELTVG